MPWSGLGVKHGRCVDDSNFHNDPMAPTETTSDATNTTSQSNTRFDLFRNFGAETAHLLSNDDKLSSKAFGYMAGAATGKVDGTKETRLKLLNGVKPTSSSKKISHSGIQNHKYNKFYLFRQGTHYDSQPPSMLTIPLLDLEDVLGWNGTDEYDVMAITFGEDAPFCQMQVLSTADAISGSNGPVQAHVEKGRHLLEAFIKGLASSNLQHPVEENFGPDEGRTNPPYQQWLRLLAEIRNSERPKSIHVPEPKKDVDWSKIKIAIGRADLTSSLPDPFCMAVKAAMNYPSYRGMALLPSCPPAASETSSSNEQVNTLQGQDDDRIAGNSGRDFSAVAKSFQNPNRRLVELFSSE